MSGEVLQKPGTQDEDNKTLVLDGTTDEREPGEQNKYHLTYLTGDEKRFEL